MYKSAEIYNILPNAATKKMEGRLDFVLMSALLRTIGQLGNYTVDSYAGAGVRVPKRAR